MSIAEDCIHKIVGSPQLGRAWNAAVVIQGPYVWNYTRTCIEEFITRNTDILVIVATYLPDDMSALPLSPYELARISEGVLVFIFVKIPNREQWPEFWRTNQANQNLQRLSSYAGLRYAASLGIEYSLKIRSDTFLGRPAVISYMRMQLEKHYPPFPTESDSIMKGRLVVGAAGSFCEPHPHPQYPYYINDHFYFGHTTDVLAFFNLSTGWDNGSGMRIAHPEHSLTTRWMQDMNIRVPTTRELLARYFIIEDPHDVETARLDPRGLHGCWWSFNYYRYLKEGSSYVKEAYGGAAYGAIGLTRNLWEDLVKNLYDSRQSDVAVHKTAPLTRCQADKTDE